MPTDTEVERRMRELEAEVRATRAANPPPAAAPPPPRVAAPLATTRRAVEIAEAPPAKKPGFFMRLFARQSWKTKLLIVGGVVLAGFVTVWIVGKVLKLALYAGAALAVGFAAWWVYSKIKGKPRA